MAAELKILTQNAIAGYKETLKVNSRFRSLLSRLALSQILFSSKLTLREREFLQKYFSFNPILKF